MAEYSHHGDTSSQYPLGNDVSEKDRLHIQHNAWVALLHGKAVQTSFTTAPSTIVDIGCGVNADMTILLAKAFPSAKVYAVDLSPISLTENVPSNVEFITGNIVNLIDKDPRLTAGSIDFVFSRFLIAGIPDWASHIEQVSRLVSPGGWMEMQDSWAIAWRNGQGKVISQDWEWLTYVQKPIEFPPDDQTGEKQFIDIYKANGFQDIGSKVVECSWTPKELIKDPDSLPWADYLASGHMVRPFNALFNRLLSGDENKQLREKLISENERTLAPEEGKNMPLIAIWGRK